MSLSSYPLIALDFNNNEHNLEKQGHSQGNAADRLLREHSNFRAVLNGNKQGGKNNPYRKLVRTQHGVEADATQTTLGQAFLEAQSMQSLEAGQLILSALQKKGLRLEILVEEDGTEKLVVRPKGVITPEESAEIDENQGSILVLLRKQEEEAGRDTHDDAAVPRESQRDIVRKMIPELPENFIRYDLERVLHSWKYHDLADKSSKLDNLLAWCATRGLILRTGKGHYRRLPFPVKKTTSEPSTPIESPEVLHEVAGAPETSQLGFGPVARADIGNMLTTQAATHIAEVSSAPSARASLEPVKSLDQPTPMEQSAGAIATSERVVSPSLAHALIDLSSELVAVPIDESTLDAVERGFLEFYERMDALIKHLRANARARNRLRTQLASATDREI